MQAPRSNTAVGGARPVAASSLASRSSSAQGWTGGSSTLPPPTSPSRRELGLSHIVRPWSASPSNPDFVSHSAQSEVAYSSGKRAVSTRPDGAASVHYPDGRIAVVLSVTQSRDTLSLSSYIYDRDAAHTLLGSFDSHGHGSIAESTVGLKGARGRPCFDSQGQKAACQCTQFHPQTDARQMCSSCPHSTGSHESGRMVLSGVKGLSLIDRRGNKISPTEKEPFKLPFEMRINKELVFRVHAAPSGQAQFSVEFACDGVRHQASLQLASVRPPKAALANTTPSLGTSISSPKFLEQARLKGEANAAKGDVSISSLLSTLNDLQSKILNTLQTSHDPSIATKTFGTSTKNFPSPFARTDDQLSGLTYNEEFAARNPALKRGQAIRSASGKYSLAQAVPKSTLKQKALPQLTNLTFDSAIASDANRGKVVAIFCYASFIPTTDRFEKILENLNGSLAAAAESDDPSLAAQSTAASFYSIYKYVLSHSRMLIERYNLRFSPGLLIFFNGRLVRGEYLGSIPVKHKRRPPTCVLLESDWTLQYRIETVIRQTVTNGEGTPWSSILAPNLPDLIKYAESNGGATRYEAIILDLDAWTPNELETIWKIVCKSRIGTGSRPVSAVGGNHSSNNGTNAASLPPPFVIGYSARSQQEATKYASFALGAFITKVNGNVNTREVLKALQRAHKLVAPPVGHTGVDKVDLLNMLHSSYEAGMRGKFLPSDFKFAVEMVQAVAEAQARIAAGGTLSNSVLNTSSLYTLPPPPPPPKVEEPLPAKLDRKGTRTSKGK